jgi:hypothetical protein
MLFQARFLNTHNLRDLAPSEKESMMQPENRATEQAAVEIFAKSIYRELRAGGYSGQDVMHLASELLSLLSRDVQVEGARPAA